MGAFDGIRWDSTGLSDTEVGKCDGLITSVANLDNRAEAGVLCEKKKKECGE